jgi:hypothetical protein
MIKLKMDDLDDGVEFKTTKELTGQVFGKWTVLRRSDDRKEKGYYVMRCVCGAEHDKKGSDIAGLLSSQCLRCRIKERRSFNKVRFDRM